MEHKKNINGPVRLIEIETIMSIHYFEFGADFNFSGETHDYWELVYIDRGKARVSANEASLSLSQGEIVFHRPGLSRILVRNTLPDSFECRRSHSGSGGLTSFRRWAWRRRQAS